jgi:hypothetical protein
MSLRFAFTGNRAALRLPPEQPYVAIVASRLAAHDSQSQLRPSDDLDALAARFTAAITCGDRPLVRDWSKIAWCLWTTKPAIAENDGTLSEVLARVDHRPDRRQPYRSLATVYLTEFAPNRPRLERIAGVLARRANAADDAWAHLQAQHGVFDGDQAPRKLARSLLPAGANVPRALSAFGLSETLIFGGFAGAVHDEGLNMLRARHPTSIQGRLAEVREWCFDPDGKLMFENSKAEIARALVLPFSDTGPSVARTELLEFVTTCFGDPRTRPAAWNQMRDTEAIAKRWLTSQTLQQFFDVVARVANPNQFRYRRAFWSAVERAGLICDAQVAFAAGGAAEALHAFGANSSFALLRSSPGRPVQSNHAVLLLDLGQCFVADWSHDGRCNLWSSGSNDQPKIRHAQGKGNSRPSYSSSEVRRKLPTDQTEVNLNRSDIFSHVGSENYLWQDRVAKRIHGRTGVRVPEASYRLR